MAVREGRWDCTYCGTTGILGRHTTCTNCGRSRAKGTRFYLPENEGQVKDRELLALAQAGEDWICPYCDSSNRAGQTSCQHCGSPRQAGTPVQSKIRYAPGQEPRQGDNVGPAALAITPAPQRRSGWLRALPSWLLLAVAAVTLMCGLAGFVVFKTYEVELTVTEVSWFRAVPVEAYRTVTEGDWALPEGGRSLRSEEQIHHYDQVVDHYETKTREVCEEVQTGTESYTCGSRDLGNGFFEDEQCTRPVYQSRCHDESYQDPVYRDVPVYQTWYTYEIEKWVLDRTETASGHNHQVYWPEVSLADNERIGERSESYAVEFVDAEGKTYTELLPYDDWLDYEAGEKVIAQVDIFGEVMELQAGE